MSSENKWNAFGAMYQKTNWNRTVETSIDKTTGSFLNSDNCTVEFPKQPHCTDAFFPTVVVSPKKPLKIAQGQNTIFKLGRDMYFGDLDGRNGMVSFAWYNTKNNAIDFHSRYSKAFPGTLFSSIYEPNIINNPEISDSTRGGGLAQVLHDTANAYGFTLTLYPDKGWYDSATHLLSGALFKDSTRVSYYKLSVIKYEPSETNPNTLVKTITTTEGYLPKSIDLSCETFVSVHEAFEEYHICINGSEIDSVPAPVGDDFRNLKDNNCYFAMCVMGAHDSGVSLDIKNLTHTELKEE